MKKINRKPDNSAPNHRRVLHLSKEAIRTLGSDELEQAVSGCDTTSWTTETRNAQGGI